MLKKNPLFLCIIYTKKKKKFSVEIFDKSSNKCVDNLFKALKSNNVCSFKPKQQQKTVKRGSEN